MEISGLDAPQQSTRVLHLQVSSSPGRRVAVVKPDSDEESLALTCKTLGLNTNEVLGFFTENDFLVDLKKVRDEATILVKLKEGADSSSMQGLDFGIHEFGLTEWKVGGEWPIYLCEQPEQGWQALRLEIQLGPDSGGLPDGTLLRTSALLNVHIDGVLWDSSYWFLLKKQREPAFKIPYNNPSSSWFNINLLGLKQVWQSKDHVDICGYPNHRLYLLAVESQNSLGQPQKELLAFVLDKREVERLCEDSWMQLIGEGKLPLVFDIDETLVEATELLSEEALKDYESSAYTFRLGRSIIGVKIRLGARAMLLRLQRYFQFSICTAGDPLYAQEVIKCCNSHDWLPRNHIQERSSQTPWTKLLPPERIISTRPRKDYLGDDKKSLTFLYPFVYSPTNLRLPIIVDDRRDMWRPEHRRNVYWVKAYKSLTSQGNCLNVVTKALEDVHMQFFKLRPLVPPNRDLVQITQDSDVRRCLDELFRSKPR